ncbi:MAG: bifunctional DNA-formamidopyrimidine glycosylase/DNA-(apurinic or apyrimidinic site) lyase [Bacillota bacterium]
MPELPEVETIRADLERLVVGDRIAEARIVDPRLAQGTAPGAMAAALRGQKIRQAGRRGKYLLMELDAYRLIIHLRMTGRMLLAGTGAQPDKHVRAILTLRSSRSLWFRDIRRFGTWRLVPAGDAGQPGALSLGPEPLGDEFTPGYLLAVLTGRKAPVKAILLDQRHVAGLGNIYVDEALFRAGLDPRRPAGSLTPEETRRLVGEIRGTLRESIANRGTSMRDYGGLEELGSFQNSLRVYRRTGEQCVREGCDAVICRTVLGGRGTHYCPRCQR